MAIPPRFMTDLRDRLTLSEIVGRKVKLTRAGREHKGCCPFHHEKSPSFYVNDEKQFYHCFGCGAHGDAIGFAMQHDNLSFIEALELLAAQAGMQVPAQSPHEVARAREEKDLYSLLDVAAKFFSLELSRPAQAAAREYLLGRGMAAEMIATFRVGFAPADGQAVRAHLKAAGYTDAQMIEAGVLRKSERGGEPYSFFRDRIMFPVADRRGRVVAFGGRVLPGAHKDAPKYINSADSALFHKGRMLYGESHARAAAADGQAVLVVEGYMDVLACFQGGFRGAVAPNGTALTEDQILALWKMIPDAPRVPVLCFDGDEAGRRAAGRAVARILPMLKPDHSARIAFLPQGEDPDSLLRRAGAPALQSVLDAALSLDEFLWQAFTLDKRFMTPEAQAGLKTQLEDEAGKIADREVQYYYRQSFRDRLFKFFRTGKKAVTPGRPAGLVTPAVPKSEFLPRQMLALVLQNPWLLDEVEEEFAGLTWVDARLDRLRQTIIATHAENNSLDPDQWRNHLNDLGFAAELANIQMTAGSDSSDVKEQWQALRTMQEGHRFSIAADKVKISAQGLLPPGFGRKVANAGHSDSES